MQNKNAALQNHEIKMQKYNVYCFIMFYIMRTTTMMMMMMQIKQSILSNICRQTYKNVNNAKCRWFFCGYIASKLTISFVHEYLSIYEMLNVWY